MPKQMHKQIDREAQQQAAQILANINKRSDWTMDMPKIAYQPDSDSNESLGGEEIKEQDHEDGCELEDLELGQDDFISAESDASTKK